MFLGVDLGGTKTALSIAGENGVITDKVWFPTAGPEETIGRIIREGKRLVGGRKLLGIIHGNFAANTKNAGAITIFVRIKGYGA